MNPILSLGLLKIGKEAVDFIITKPHLSAKADNLKEVPFSQYLDAARRPSKVTDLSRLLQESGIQNLADLRNTLFHLTQQFVKDPAFARFSADDFRNGSFYLQGDANGGLYLIGPDGKQAEFSAQSALGERARTIRQLSSLLQEAEAAAPGTSLDFLAGMADHSAPESELWNFKLELR